MSEHDFVTRGEAFTVYRDTRPEKCNPPLSNCKATVAYSVVVSDRYGNALYTVSRCKEHLLEELRRSRPECEQARLEMQMAIEKLEGGEF